MKQKFPVNGSNQSVSHNQSKFISGAIETCAGQHYYRSVILAVSGSLFCVAASERAVAQSAGAAQQTANQTLEETAQALPPAIFVGLNTVADAQMSSHLLEAPESGWICSDLQSSSINWNNDELWHPAEQLELFSWQRVPKIAGNSPSVAAPSAAGTTAPVVSATALGTTAVAPGTSATTPGASADANATLTLPGLPIQQPKVYKNELSASADFMFGTGTITVPIGYAFRGISTQFPVNAVSANRSTVYYGGTVSYSYGRSWYLDFSGEKGTSTGSTSITIPELGGGTFPASFDVNDTWYQIYLRYNFQNFLAGTRFRAYLRGGLSLVSATLDTVNSTFTSGQHFPTGQFYSEHDNTFDILGNLGFGLTYSLYSTVRLKVGLQLEGEGFGGNRSQDITETFVPSTLSDNAKINNTIYGVIGRLTLHADYRLGQTGRWKLTGDVGVMTKNSWVSYPNFGTKDETLYGPYAKAGVSFVF